jgi:glutathione S-transferase
MTSAVVYGFRGSPFVEKVVAGLSIKGIPWKFQETATPGDMARCSPITRKMPAIRIGDETLYDSTLILRRLEWLQPTPALWSDDPQIAAQQRLLEDWCDESIYWYIMAMRWQPANAAGAINQITSGMSEPLAYVLGKILARKMTKATQEQGLGRLPEAVLNAELKQILADLSAMLGNSPYFLSDEIGAADLAVYGQLGFGLSGTTPAFTLAVEGHANLLAFHDRVATAIELHSKSIKGSV